MNIFSYSPKEVILTVAGYQVTGWQSITIARSVQGFQTIRGIRGKNTRVQNLDTSATITIPLLQTSQSNDVLSRIHELDLQNGTGRCEITLKDMSGKSVFSTVEAYVTGYPSVTFSGDAEYRTWVLSALSTGSYNVAGNSGPQGSLFDAALGQAGNILSNIFG